MERKKNNGEVNIEQECSVTVDGGNELASREVGRWIKIVSNYTIEQAYKMLSIKERHAVDLVIDYILTNGTDDSENGLGYLAHIINNIDNHILQNTAFYLIGLAGSTSVCKESFLFLDIYQEE